MKSDIVIFTLTLVACVGFVMPHMHMNHETGDKVHNKPQKSQYRSGTVFLDSSGKFSFKADVIDKDHGVAYGYFNNTLNETGWGVLEITAECSKRKSLDESTSCTDNDAMYAAGLLEGILTSEQIWQNYLNIRPFYLDPNNSTMEMLYRWFFRKQDEWTRQNIKSNHDEVWTVISFIMSQFDGLAEGYRQAASSTWESDVFVPQFLNAVGDMIDLRYFLKPSMRPDFRKMTKSQLRSYISANGHCSALIKVTGGFENIFMSHSSWFVYAATMRIYKHYHFNLNSPLAAMKSVSFSSYPGFLESLDDFYLLDTGLVVLQTTNQVFNTSLYDQITPSSLLAWQRVRAANIMSHHGHEWSKYFSRYNSGTYNNQYMVIDLNKINLNKNIEEGALHIIEQIPLHVATVDATEILNRGYFASYNVPFIDEIYQESGYPDMVALHGTDFSYQLAPRAKIFRRDAGNVETLQDMMDIMRYNNYKNDTYSKGNACNTICCRGDLVTDMDALKQEHVSGCYDTKLADYFMAMKLRSVAINGPTTSHQLPPFSWTGKYASESHIGLPTEYKFNWQVMEPLL